MNLVSNSQQILDEFTRTVDLSPKQTFEEFIRKIPQPSPQWVLDEFSLSVDSPEQKETK